MRYQIKQKLLSLTAQLDIADEAGEPILVARRTAFSLRIEYRLVSLAGDEFVRIRQRWMSWLPAFEVTRHDEVLATVRRRFSFRPRYTIDLASGETLTVSGSLMELHYEFTRGDETVARVSREMWSIRDTYGAEVLDPRLDAVVLATVVAIDALRSQQKQAA